MVKNLPAMWKPGFNLWIGDFSWKRAWQPPPVFLPWEFSHGQRILEGYSPWGCKELDMTEQLGTAQHTHTHTHTHTLTYTQTNVTQRATAEPLQLWN